MEAERVCVVCEVAVKIDVLVNVVNAFGRSAEIESERAEADAAKLS